jgi:hypothetical protein
MRDSQLPASLIYSSPDSALQIQSMTLREVTRTVISLVENVSGCPVVVSEDASLKTLAASRIARGRMEFTRFHTTRPPLGNRII